MKKLILAIALSLFSVSSASSEVLSERDSTTGESNLISPETNVDYNSLQNLLAAGEWREANDETLDLALKATKRENQGWLSAEDIEQFPCWDLREIDNLWQQYSDRRFGFSVQLPIYVKAGNKPGRLVDQESYERFGDRVGWRKNGDWIVFIEDLNYSIDAPIGHLPNPRSQYELTGNRLEYSTLAKRIVECKIVDIPETENSPREIPEFQPSPIR